MSEITMGTGVRVRVRVRVRVGVRVGAELAVLHLAARVVLIPLNCA